MLLKLLFWIYTYPVYGVWEEDDGHLHKAQNFNIYLEVKTQEVLDWDLQSGSKCTILALEVVAENLDQTAKNHL